MNSNFCEEEIEMGFDVCSRYRLQQFWNIHFMGIYEVFEIDNKKCQEAYKIIKNELLQ